MPKWMKPGLLIIIMIASLLMLMSCGSGDDLPVSRTDPLEIVTGDESGPGGGLDGSGGGGGATGACEFSISFGGFTTTSCYPDYTSSICSQLTAGGGTVNFTSGATCESLGYTCQVLGGVTVCM